MTLRGREGTDPECGRPAGAGGAGAGVAAGGIQLLAAGEGPPGSQPAKSPGDPCVGPIAS